ncbi:hypothetical protein EV177_008182 [Coemansia sp. RSA 1804]|nr:hypothetical protein EV177_008182 [Coemansia sp. RSA 1804]
MSHAASSRAITSPMLNRRKTLSRATPAMANVPIPEIPSGHPHSRLPPATISRGNSRTRPISTAGSIASNRTSSPSLSRPASRLMAPTSSTEPNMLALSPPRPASFQRTKPLGSTPATDQRQSRRNTGMHRPTATLSGRLAEQSNGRVSGAAPKSRTGAPADSVDRLRLRVDMLEAENRVLRLKNEQDKAHLAAGQMLARDLAIVNGSTSPQGKGVSLSPNSSDISMAEQHLKEAHDTLEREYRDSVIRTLEAQLSNKVEETSALNARIGDVSEELEKVTQLYRQLLGKGDVENSSEKSTNDGDVTSLNGQIERLQHELATSENAKMELIAELDDTKQMLSTARDQVDSAQCILDDTKMRLVDRDDMHAMVETYHGSMLQIARLLGGCPDEYGELVKQTLDGIPSKFDEAAVSQEVVGQLSSKVGECLSRLIKKADASSSQIETMAGEAQVKDARISVLETEVSDLKRQLAQSPSETLAESDDHVSSSQLQYFQSRIEELESSNYQLEEKCDTLEEERILFNEYLKTLEAESNRLVDDIDLLTAQNQKLAEDLRVASMQNSTVSLDTIALDAKLGREPLSANSTGFDSSDPAAGSDAHPADASVEKDTTADLDSLRHKHEREVSTLQSRLADLELRKNNDIKKLQDEISTWENLVEDKIFKEAEFNDTISNLTNQIDRLQREIQRSCVPVVAASRDSNVQANDTRAASSNSLTASPHTNTNASDLRASSGDMKGATEPAVDSIDDEALFCDICESPGHGISDCPQMTTPANIFKQDVSIDSSRPYCDNCEAFQGHWTEDCPHGDEMF